MKQLVDAVLPKWGNFACGLFLFNPSLLAEAHLPHEETLCLFFLTMLIFYLYRYRLDPSLRIASLIAGFCALAILSRADFQFLVLLLPITLWFIYPKHAQGMPPTRWIAPVTAFLVIATMLLPWIAHQDLHGNGRSLASYDREWLFFIDNLRFVTPELPGEVNEKWKIEWIKHQEKRLSIAINGWESLSNEERWRHKLTDIRQFFLSFPYSLETFIVAASLSTARFFLSGGVGAIHSNFNLHHRANERPFTFFGLKALALSYSTFARMLCLIAVFSLIWNPKAHGRGALVAICIGLIAYTYIAHGFQGKPRFRVPAESALAILATFGWVNVRKFLPHLKVKSLR